MQGTRFNGFRNDSSKTVEPVFCQCLLFGTGLKSGVNEKDFEASLVLGNSLTESGDSLIDATTLPDRQNMTRVRKDRWLMPIFVSRN